VLVEDGGHTVTFENDSGELITIDKLEVSTPDFSPHRFRVARQTRRICTARRHPG